MRLRSGGPPIPRLAKLRPFTDVSAADWRAGLENVAAALSSSPLSGHLAVIVPGRERREILIDLDQPHAKEIPKDRPAAGGTQANLIVYVNEDSLEMILRGELSPLEAFLRGGLRYAGDEELGIAILRSLASTEDAVFEPCRDEGW